MGLFEWFTDVTSGPSCDTVASWVAQLRDPFFSLTQVRQMAAGEYDETAYDAIVPGAPRSAYVTVSRALYGSSADVEAATKFLRAARKTPRSVGSCGYVGFMSDVNRARMLDALAGYSARFTSIDAAAVAGVLTDVFDDAAASQNPASPESAVVYAATKLVRDSNGAFDQAAWLPLWRWTLGGPGGRAAVGVRVGAMQALQAVLRRGSLTPRQVLAASSMSDVLRQLVEQRAPAIANAQQRELLLADANALWGAMRIALLNAAQAAPAAAAVVNAAPTARRWLLPVAAAVVVGTTIMVAYRRRHA